MKNGILDRLMIFCYVVLTVALAVITALRIFGIDLAQRLFDGLAINAPGVLWKLIIVGVAVIITLLGILTIVVITPSRKKKSNFITISGDESGEVRVAMPALKDMVMQAVGKIEGLSEMNVSVTDGGDSIAVAIDLDVDTSVHVPTLTMNMQSAVRTYIQTSCGVAVKNVSVTVHNIIASPEAQSMIIETTAPEISVPEVEEIVAESAGEEEVVVPAEDVSAEEIPAEEITEEVSEEENSEEKE